MTFLKLGSFQTQPKFFKAQPSYSAKQPNPSKEIPWISLDSLVRIETFQWVAPTPGQKKSLLAFFRESGVGLA
jgi:hypothetical protein